MEPSSNNPSSKVHHADGIAQPSERKVINDTANTTGFFSSLWEGKKAKRLDLDPSDPKHGLAVRILEEPALQHGKREIDHTGKNEDWVYLQGKGGNKRVEVASLANRLGIAKSEVLTLAGKGELEGKIQTVIQNKHAIDQFNVIVINIINGDKKIPDNIKVIRNKEWEGMDVSARLKTVINKFDVKYIVNNEVRELFEKLQKDCDTAQKDCDTAPNDIKLHLNEFYEKLIALDNRYSLKQEITGAITLWGNTVVKLSKAAKDPKGHEGREAVRVFLGRKNDTSLAVMTDGNVYKYQPKATSTHVPYSKDGKTWLLLEKRSFASRSVPSASLDDYRVEISDKQQPQIDKELGKSFIENALTIIAAHLRGGSKLADSKFKYLENGVLKETDLEFIIGNLETIAINSNHTEMQKIIDDVIKAITSMKKYQTQSNSLQFANQLIKLREKSIIDINKLDQIEKKDDFHWRNF